MRAPPNRGPLYSRLLKSSRIPLPSPLNPANCRRRAPTMSGGDPYRAGGKGRASPPYSYVPEAEKQWTSWLIPVVVVANVAMFIIAMFVNDCPKKHNPLLGQCVARFLGRFSFQPLSENPFFGPSWEILQKLGGLVHDKVIHGDEGWRLLSSIWLHAGVIHLFVRIGLIYLLSGFGGSILSVLFTEASISVGASGAIFGLLGAKLSELITNWSIHSNKAAALITLIFILAVEILPLVDSLAHIGGFFSGFLLGFVLLIRPQFGWVERGHSLPSTGRFKSKYKVYQYRLWFIAFVFLVVGYVVGLVTLFGGLNGNDKCFWCHYLSCLPTSRLDCDI